MSCIYHSLMWGMCVFLLCNVVYQLVTALLLRKCSAVQRPILAESPNYSLFPFLILYLFNKEGKWHFGEPYRHG